MGEFLNFSHQQPTEESSANLLLSTWVINTSIPSTLSLHLHKKDRNRKYVPKSLDDICSVDGQSAIGQTRHQTHSSSSHISHRCCRPYDSIMRRFSTITLAHEMLEA